MTANPFSRRAAIIIGVVTIGSLVLAVVLAVFGKKETSAPISDANAYSRSAVGHRAFVTLLDRMGIPIIRSRHNSARKAGKGALLIVAEPRPFREDTERAQRLVRAGKTTLVVLPKWQVAANPNRKEWIAQVAAASAGRGHGYRSWHPRSRRRGDRATQRGAVDHEQHEDPAGAWAGPVDSVVRARAHHRVCPWDLARRGQEPSTTARSGSSPIPM